MAFLRKYGLFFPAILWIPALCFAPGLLWYWRYANVAAVVAAALLGRAELRRENIRGYALSQAAMLANAAGLILTTMLL